MIRFPYEAYPVRGVGATRHAIVHRPMIPIRIVGPAGRHDLPALVDTGADDSLLPDLLIGLLGVALRPGDHAVIVGIEGSTTVVRYGTIDLEIPGAGGGYRWSARVGFHASFRVVLGHSGFLEYFTASFNGRSRHLTLTPNGTAPAPTIPPS
jgi:hypothetical protein